ncbi:MAG: hypothetical protein J5841_07065, partial [Clostridia bacterium]|nr:hypothetical protein [Clostridia bacterium]
QAQAILDMRLQRLTNLEVEALRKEYADVLKLIARLEGILKSGKKLNEVIRKEMEAIAEEFANDRRTTLEVPEDVQVELPDNTPEPEDAVLVYTEGGYLKRIPPAQLKRNPLPTAEENLPESARWLLPTTTAENLYIFTNLGNCYPLNVGRITECKPKDRGQLLSGVLMDIEENEQPLLMLTCAPAKVKDLPDFLFITKNGMIKRTAAADYDVRSRKYPALSLKKGDSLLTVLSASGEGDLLFVTRGGMSIRFPLSTVPVQGRIATGVKGMSVESGDEVLWVSQLEETDELVLFSERGWAKRIPQLDFESQNRAGKGVRCFYFNKNGSNGRNIAGICRINRDVSCSLLISQVRSPLSKLSRDDILLQNRSGKGMPYVMAILDDIVTGVISIKDAAVPDEAPVETENSTNT